MLYIITEKHIYFYAFLEFQFHHFKLQSYFKYTPVTNGFCFFFFFPSQFSIIFKTRKILLNFNLLHLSIISIKQIKHLRSQQIEQLFYLVYTYRLFIKLLKVREFISKTVLSYADDITVYYIVCFEVSFWFLFFSFGNFCDISSGSEILSQLGTVYQQANLRHSHSCYSVFICGISLIFSVYIAH